MEDFFYAGGLPALLENLGDLLDTSAVTANGQTLGENIADAKVFDDDVIRSRDNPMVASDTLAVLYGNLAPDGAVIKPPAADPKLHRHSGPAVVFENYDDMAARIDDPIWWWTRTRCWCCRTPARRARRGCRNGASCRSRRRSWRQGVRDMVRISDARMSGTSYGACVLHVAPGVLRRRPARPGRDGDIIELDVPTGN